MRTLTRVAVIIEFAFSVIVFIIGFYSLFMGVKLWWIPPGIGAITAFTGLMLLISYHTMNRLKDGGKHG